MKMFIPLFFLMSISATIFAEPLPLDVVMKPEEQKKCGLDKLTPEQKKAFEIWLGDWTGKVIEQAPDYHGARGLVYWVNQWPTHMAPLKIATEEEIKESQNESNQQIDKIKNDGEILELKDGSVWRISKYEAKKVSKWTRNDKIEPVKTDLDFPPYRLKNVNKREFADASLEMPAAESGKKEPESAEYYAGALHIAQINPHTGIIELSDGSEWKIATAGQKKLTQGKKYEPKAEWRIHDRIQIEKSDDFIYPYMLHNLDFGESVKANKLN